MATTPISGLSSGINWTSIVSELVTASSGGITHARAQQATVNSQVSALGSLTTDMNGLSSAIFSLESPAAYNAVSAASTTTGSTWAVSAEAGTPTGSYPIDVTNLATSSQLNGNPGISASLNAGGAATTTPLASLDTTDAITPGTFTVNGQQITITTAETLSDVFAAIASATSGAVSGSYGPGDTVTLSGGSTPVVLGAVNDTSNFLQEMKLSNTGTTVTSVTSSSSLGAVQLGSPIASANLKTALTGLDPSGNGSLAINGVTINYNANTTTMATLLGLITKSGAGVTASYDTTNDSMVLTNTSTGDIGIGANDLSGNLLAALGLTSGTGATLAQGANATYSVNGGPTRTSTSNTLGPSALGVSGLSVTVNTKGPQTVQVSGATAALQTAIQTFITNFNTLQSGIEGDTAINVQANGTVSTAVLSSDTEVASWSHMLETVAFSAGNGVGGAVNSLHDLGIEFNGTTGQLQIADSAKLQQVLIQSPLAVSAFFQTAHTGFGSTLTTTLNDLINRSADAQQTLQGTSTRLGTQIATMQNQLNAQQQALDSEFQTMETLMSQYQTESTTLTNMFSGTASSLGSIATSVNNSAAATTSPLSNIAPSVNSSTGSSSSA